ncbi:MAG: transketolase [Actinomycetota bacterium]|nr:transketolase [Actinomycetota bacterium]MDA8317707.1 transketolase [Actinomycetota bacterium]MDA8358546.1 transketolase [Actinomycetota bacterium]
MARTNTTTPRTTDVARQMRLDILDEIFEAGSGHPGGSLSCADLLACLFSTRVDPRALLEDRLERNHIILSKGHAAPALYAALAAVGAIPRDELHTLRQLGTRLQGHPDRTRLPAVEMSTGSLGQGLSTGCGLAWEMSRRQVQGRTFVVLGDGELDEGQIWEAVAFAGATHLANLVAVIDANGIQNDGPVEQILDLRPYPAKLAAFGWRTKEIDGHNHDEILEALDWSESGKDAPSAIVAHTIKGRGVSFMEGRPEWHSHGLTPEQLALATREVSSR